MSEWLKKNSIQLISSLGILAAALLVIIVVREASSSREAARLDDALSSAVAETARLNAEIGRLNAESVASKAEIKRLSDLNDALKALAEATEKANGEILFENGMMYAQGRDIGQNYEEAFKFYLKSAEAGDSAAMNAVGFMRRNGQGVPQDYGEAMKWYRAAASNGYAAAMNNIGYLYELGLGIAPDRQEAMKWYLQAAEGGDGEAMAHLGHLYAEGPNTDLDAAIGWYRRAASLGSAEAMKRLAYLYHAGNGVERDMRASANWYLRALEAESSDSPPAYREILKADSADSAYEKEMLSAPEVALPSASGEDMYFFLKVADMESVASSIEALRDGFSIFAEEDSEMISYHDMAGISNIISSLDFLKTLADAVSGVSALVVPSEKSGSGLYAAFFADTSKFDEIIRSGRFPVPLEEWAGPGAKVDGAWALESPETPNARIFAVKRQFGNKCLVMMSYGIDSGIDRMIRAFEGQDDYFETKRDTEGENYASIKFKDPMEIEGLKFQTAENSWSIDEDGLHIRSYSDLLDEGGLGERSGAAMAPSPMGDGEVALYFSIDVSHHIRALFRGVGNPFKAFVGKLGIDRFPIDLAAIAEEIANNARISAVVTATGEDELSTAYVVLESPAKASIARLYSLVGMFFEKEADTSGTRWDSAYSVDVGIGQYLTVAKSGNSVILGLGKIDAFGAEAKMPEQIKPLPPSDPLSFFFTSKLPRMKSGLFEGPFSSLIASQLLKRGAIESALFDASIGAIDSFRMTGERSGRSSIDITLNKRPNENGDSFVVKVIRSIFTPGKTTGAEDDGAKATRVIDSLRNLKAAALLFYGDMREWPDSPDDAPALDEYTDSKPLTVNARFGLRFATAELDGKSISLIGFDLEDGPDPGEITPAARDILRGAAENYGLYDGDGGYYSGGRLIFMMMP
ncbi:MAG: sel1 repeat family protein [Synergistaceae bacterium]|nr:sel1 repeat family protein [Synergistaceae bacterium]